MQKWHRWHVVGTVSTSLAPLAGRWHVFFFPDARPSLISKEPEFNLEYLRFAY
jgi:hypothetical protein